MRKQNKSLEEIRNKIEELKGKQLVVVVNKGRNRFVTLDASIDKVYPSMFMIKAECQTDLDRLTYSYSDVLCGDIKFKIQ